MKKVAFDGDLFNATNNGHTEKYTKRIGEVSTFREKNWGKNLRPS
jgi:hypothetical protein